MILASRKIWSTETDKNWVQYFSMDIFVRTRLLLERGQKYENSAVYGSFIVFQRLKPIVFEEKNPSKGQLNKISKNI